MNRKIAMSAMSIFSALAIMGGTTYAAFLSNASNEGNTFGAGTLVLTLNGAGGNTSTPLFTLPSGQAPGTTTFQDLTFANTGSVAASTVQMSSINNITNTTLGDNLVLTLWDDTDDDDEVDGGETVYGSFALTDSTWTGHTLTGLTLPAGGSKLVKAGLEFVIGAPNTLQGASTTFNLNFTAVQ